MKCIKIYSPRLNSFHGKECESVKIVELYAESFVTEKCGAKSCSSRETPKMDHEESVDLNTRNTNNNNIETKKRSLKFEFCFETV